MSKSKNHPDRSDYPQVLSISAAPPGWWARYRDGDSAISRAPVAVFAVVEEDGIQRVTTFSAIGDSSWNDGPDDGASNFDGIEYDPSLLSNGS